MRSYPAWGASLTAQVERDRTLGYQEPHWKEFHFDLTQIPAGEAVTAAEFRIYKEPSTHPLNTTLHISMFEVVQEHSNRRSDLGTRAGWCWTSQQPVTDGC